MAFISYAVQLLLNLLALGLGFWLLARSKRALVQQSVTST